MLSNNPIVNFIVLVFVLVFVCLLVCLVGWLVVCSFVHLFVCLSVCLFVCFSVVSFAWIVVSVVLCGLFFLTPHCPSSSSTQFPRFPEIGVPHGTPSSHPFLDWDFPWNTLSSIFGVPPWLWRPLGEFRPLLRRRRWRQAGSGSTEPHQGRAQRALGGDRGRVPKHRGLPWASLGEAVGKWGDHPSFYGDINQGRSSWYQLTNCHININWYIFKNGITWGSLG